MPTESEEKHQREKRAELSRKIEELTADLAVHNRNLAKSYAGMTTEEIAKRMAEAQRIVSERAGCRSALTRLRGSP